MPGSCNIITKTMKRNFGNLTVNSELNLNPVIVSVIFPCLNQSSAATMQFHRSLLNNKHTIKSKDLNFAPERFTSLHKKA